jgi:hypothetical protein
VLRLFCRFFRRFLPVFCGFPGPCASESGDMSPLSESSTACSLAPRNFQPESEILVLKVECVLANFFCSWNKCIRQFKTHKR